MSPPWIFMMSDIPSVHYELCRRRMLIVTLHNVTVLTPAPLIREHEKRVFTMLTLIGQREINNSIRITNNLSKLFISSHCCILITTFPIFCFIECYKLIINFITLFVVTDNTMLQKFIFSISLKKSIDGVLNM